MITAKQVVEALREVVAGHEDYVYTFDGMVGCRYATAAGEPSCLVGHAVLKLDEAMFQKLRAIENSVEKSPSIGWSAELGKPDILGISQAGLQILQSAQSMQDDHSRWGEALRSAEEYYAELKAAGVTE